MNRDRMRALVFERPAARAELEGILHPLIRSETARQLGLVQSPYGILMIPLLVEAAGRDPLHWRDRYDRILVADCSESTQISRVMARNGFDETAVRRIMAAQATREQRLAQADDVVDNDGDLAALGPQVERLHRLYLEYAGAGRQADTGV
jgi:dephospho-CoA kinase